MTKKFYVSRTVYHYEVEGAIVKVKDGSPYFEEKKKVDFNLPAKADDKVILSIFTSLTNLNSVVILSVKEDAKTHRLKFEDFVKTSEVFERPKSQKRKEN